MIRRKGVSQLLAITITIAMVLSIGAFIFAWSIGLIKIGASTHDVVINAVLSKSDSGTYLTINIKNVAPIDVSGLRISFDNQLYQVNRIRNIGTLFYGLCLNYFEVIGTEDGTTVKFEALRGDSSVAGSWSITVNKGQRYRFDGWDLWMHRITSDKPIAIFTSSIGPDHSSDDDFYSLAGTDLWLWIPSGAGRSGTVMITAYQDHTKVSITDYTNGDDTRSFTLNKGGFWEGYNAVDTSPGEVWHIESSKPITVMAGYPNNDEYEEVKSPYPNEYYFTLIGNNPYVVVEAQYDNTNVVIDNLDGSSGDWSGALNAGDKAVQYIPYSKSDNGVKWVRVHVYANKPIEVLNADPGNYGASEHDFWDYINNALGNRRLYITALSDASVTISGDISWSGKIVKGGTAVINWIGSWKSMHIESNGYLVIYTIGSGWVEGITPVFPIPYIPAGGSISITIPLPNSINIYQSHSVTVEVYFVDGSFKEYTFSIRAG